MGAADIPPHEHVNLSRWHQYGLPDPDSLEERISRAEHHAGLPIGRKYHQSHCWLCRRAHVQREEARRARRDLTDEWIGRTVAVHRRGSLAAAVGVLSHITRHGETVWLRLNGDYWLEAHPDTVITEQEVPFV